MRAKTGCCLQRGADVDEIIRALLRPSPQLQFPMQATQHTKFQTDFPLPHIVPKLVLHRKDLTGADDANCSLQGDAGSLEAVYAEWLRRRKLTEKLRELNKLNKTK